MRASTNGCAAAMKRAAKGVGRQPAATKHVGRLSAAAGRFAGLRALGQAGGIPESPEAAVLDRVANTARDVPYLVRFTCPEFTAICPVTGQPDFAHFVIDYVPDRWLVESKSLKLFFASFRNTGIFHEDCSVGIARRLQREIKPRWLRLAGYWYPRGGMPIDVYYQTGSPPAGLWLPDPGVAPYRGRG